jgi:hypothetical protein
MTRAAPRMRHRPTAIPVDSSLIQSVTYADDATLTVRFHSGAEYCYYTVPRSTLEAFLAAPSKGTYFNRHIREAFPFRRVLDPTSSPGPTP